MANTFDATLVNTILAQRAITKLAGKFAYLANFSTDFSDELRDTRSRTILVPLVSTGPAEDNPTNFESTSTVMDAVNVTMDLVSKSTSISYADYQKGRRLELLADAAANAMAARIEAKIFSLITTGNYGSATVSISAGGSLTPADIHKVWGALPSDVKNLVLKQTYFASLLPNDLNSYDITKQKSAFGFDNIDYSTNGFFNAGSNIVGFGAAPQAIAMASAIPAWTDAVNAELMDVQNVEVPGVGITVQSSVWASKATRDTYHNFSVLFGAQKGDDTALKIIVQAL